MSGFRSLQGRLDDAGDAGIIAITYTPAASGVTGSLSATIDPITSSATGAVVVTGALSQTIAAVALLAAAKTAAPRSAITVGWPSANLVVESGSCDAILPSVLG
jgi:hypothetical protein